MYQLCGPRCSYVPSDKLNAAHTQAYAEALDMYDEGTTFGPDDLKQDQRLVLTAQIKKAHARYVELNKSRCVSGVGVAFEIVPGTDRCVTQ